MSNPARPINPVTTLSHAPAGFNCLLSASGYGARAVRAVRLQYGMEIIENSSHKARHRSGYYPIAVHESDFSVTVVHVTVKERDSFNLWLRSYVERVLDGGRVSGYIRVQIPSSNFSMTGVPKGTLLYGENQYQANPATGEGVFYTPLVFEAAASPLGVHSSTVKAARDRTSAYFIPTGRQVAGAESLAGTIFDNSPDYVPPTLSDQEAAYSRAKAAGLIGANVSFRQYQGMVFG